MKILQWIMIKMQDNTYKSIEKFNAETKYSTVYVASAL